MEKADKYRRFRVEELNDAEELVPVLGAPVGKLIDLLVWDHGVFEGTRIFHPTSDYIRTYGDHWFDDVINSQVTREDESLGYGLWSSSEGVPDDLKDISGRWTSPSGTSQQYVFNLKNVVSAAIDAALFDGSCVMFQPTRVALIPVFPDEVALTIRVLVRFPVTRRTHAPFE